MVVPVGGLRAMGESPLELVWLRGERAVEAYGDNGVLSALEGLYG
jgi:hypothetical protein